MGLFSQPGGRATGRFGTFRKEAEAKKKGRVATGLEDELQVPEYDSSRLAGLTQEQMAPGMGLLRRGLQKARAGRYGAYFVELTQVWFWIRICLARSLPPIFPAAWRTEIQTFI